MSALGIETTANKACAVMIRVRVIAGLERQSGHTQAGRKEGGERRVLCSV